jgi:hypothetical protein
LGSNVALPTASVATRTISAAPAAPLAQWANGGNIWMLARLMTASSASNPYSIMTDYVEVQATYTLP